MGCSLFLTVSTIDSRWSEDLPKTLSYPKIKLILIKRDQGWTCCTLPFRSVWTLKKSTLSKLPTWNAACSNWTSPSTKARKRRLTFWQWLNVRIAPSRWTTIDSRTSYRPVLVLLKVSRKVVPLLYLRMKAAMMHKSRGYWSQITRIQMKRAATCNLFWSRTNRSQSRIRSFWNKISTGWLPCFLWVTESKWKSSKLILSSLTLNVWELFWPILTSKGL